MLYEVITTEGFGGVLQSCAEGFNLALLCVDFLIQDFVAGSERLHGFVIFINRITSYNVCYTKLLRLRYVSVTCASTMGNTTQGVRFQVVSDGRLPLSSGVIDNSSYTVRITSYNVCYTKLLREKAEVAMQMFFENTEQYAGNFARESTQTISGSIGLLQAALGSFTAGLGNANADIVITSYSIHYTKLYENQQEQSYQ